MTDRAPETPGWVLARLTELLMRHGVRDFAVTGSVALGFWAVPRETHDVDLCGVLPAEQVDPLLAQHDGFRAGPEALPDLVRFRVGPWDVDLFVAKDRYDRACLDRAIEAEVEGVKLRVVSAEDLAIHKLLKLRNDRRRILQDVADLRSLLEARGDQLDWSYLRTWLPAPEAELLESLRTLDDEAVLRRLMGP